MRSRRRPGRPRSLLRTFFDSAGFLVVLAMVLYGLHASGMLRPEAGGFTAIDGDSLRRGGQDYRLHAIDAPELHQTCEDRSGASYPCGREALSALGRYAESGEVECRSVETDRYGRFIATCRVGETDINGAMVHLGWAIAYRRHGLNYVDAEAEARNARRGIWQGTFETPADWRNRQRDAVTRGGMAPDATLPADD